MSASSKAEEEHPSEGRLRRTRLANTFSGGAREDETHAPRMGEHTREVLAEAGYAAAEIETMMAAGAVPAGGGSIKAIKGQHIANRHDESLGRLRGALRERSAATQGDHRAAAKPLG